MSQSEISTNSSLQEVVALRFPLHGNRLIEASAGTGKTYTIAALYLRLVLGSLPPQADGSRMEPEREPMLPTKILVVTFTEAAASELRDRIRTRLSEAAAFFRAGVEEHTLSASLSQPGPLDGLAGPLASGSSAGGAHASTQADEFLCDLRASYPPGEWGEAAIRLQLAAEWMDQAAIFTIHGWCQRMLTEHAFDSRGLFTQKLSTDTDELLAEACRDYWRTFCYGLDEKAAHQWQDWWKTPADLKKVISPLLGVGDAFESIERHTPADIFAQQRARLDGLKQPWRDGWIDWLEQRFGEAFAQGAINEQKLKTSFEKWIRSFRAWADDPLQVLPAQTEQGKPWKKGEGPFRYLTPAGLQEVWKVGEPPDHPVFQAVEDLMPRVEEMQNGRHLALRHAADWVERRYHAAREQQGLMNFDDLQLKLRNALCETGGERLATRILDQFPIALIDEFQDTDPVQYEIFDAIYNLSALPEARDEPSLGSSVQRPDVWAEDSLALTGARGRTSSGVRPALILIGDPKQAIYAFRGADIYTYLRARRATEGRHFTLERNFRASEEMVEAVNHLFQQAEDREGGSGAFHFARGLDNPVPFVRVRPKGRKEHWWDETDMEETAWADDTPVERQRREGMGTVEVRPPSRRPALTVWCPEDGDPSHDGKGAYERRFARATADEIARLLWAGRQGKAGFGDRPGVRPADIAVIVFNRTQAAQVRKALSRHGIRTVYLSDDSSVFESPVVLDLLRWLRACAEPGNGRLLRAALGTGLSGLSAHDLARIRQDDQAWDDRVTQFQRYQLIWRRQGVLPMIRHLLHDFKVTTRLLAEGRERELTDLLHLSELIQKASVLLEGEAALIRYLSEERDESGTDRDARRQRLESDDERVRVVTVHKSKGLEYPLVFFPFACDAKPETGKHELLRWHDDEGRLCCELVDPKNADEALVAQADEERLGEDLRKLYVALTRARHATWIGVAALDTLPRSALGYLLGVPPVPDACQRKAALRAALDAFQVGAQKSWLQVCPPPPETDRDWGDCSPSLEPLADPLALSPDRWPSWWIASYSALTAQLSGQTGVELNAIAHERESDGTQTGVVQRGWMALEEPYLAESATDERWAEQATMLRLEPGAPFLLDSRDTPGMLAASGTLAWQAASGLPLQDFPRGPQAGTLLHGLLEWAGREGFSRLSESPDRLQEVITKRLRRMPEWASWGDVMHAWLLGLIRQVLSLDRTSGGTGPSMGVPEAAPQDEGGAGRVGASVATGFCLATLKHYQPEMAFMLPVDQVPVTQLDAWIGRQTHGGRPRPALLDRQLNGMLKGFIDLVFVHEGRYFVLDYKSNWLGPDATHYSRERMEAAVLQHRYDVQYMFYCLALHRLLKQRIRDYDYDRHMGGAVYLFLRGMDNQTGGVFHERPERVLIETLDAAFRGKPVLQEVKRDC